MKLFVNGVQEELGQAMTIGDFLDYKGIDTKLVVIEWNFATYPREKWPQIMLQDGDNLEIIKIIGGG